MTSPITFHGQALGARDLASWRQEFAEVVRRKIEALTRDTPLRQCERPLAALYEWLGALQQPAGRIIGHARGKQQHD